MRGSSTLRATAGIWVGMLSTHKTPRREGAHAHNTMTTTRTSTARQPGSEWSISDDEWTALVRSFESATLEKASWTHAAHLAVASHYLLRMPAREALDALRQGIHKINAQHGVVNSATSGYHETLTVFWIGVLSAYLRRECAQLDSLEAVTRAVRRFEDARHLPQCVYSFALVTSSQARDTWVVPDVWEGLY